MPKANAHLEGNGERVNALLRYAAAPPVGPKFPDKSSISYQNTGGENLG